MMRARVLPASEWSRLAGTEAGALCDPVVDRATTHVLVLEADGAIVGHLVLLQVWHAECLWVAPQHRKRGVALRRLAQLAVELMARRGARSVLSAAFSDDMHALLAAIGFVPLPGVHYVVRPQEVVSCLQP